MVESEHKKSEVSHTPQSQSPLISVEKNDASDIEPTEVQENEEKKKKAKRRASRSPTPEATGGFGGNNAPVQKLTND